MPPIGRVSIVSACRQEGDAPANLPGKACLFFASFCELAGRMIQIIVTIGQLIQSFSLQLSWSTTQLNMDFGD